MDILNYITHPPVIVIYITIIDSIAGLIIGYVLYKRKVKQNGLHTSK